MWPYETNTHTCTHTLYTMLHFFHDLSLCCSCPCDDRLLPCHDLWFYCCHPFHDLSLYCSFPCHDLLYPCHGKVFLQEAHLHLSWNPSPGFQSHILDFQNNWNSVQRPHCYYHLNLYMYVIPSQRSSQQHMQHFTPEHVPVLL